MDLTYFLRTVTDFAMPACHFKVEIFKNITERESVLNFDNILAEILAKSKIWHFDFKFLI